MLATDFYARALADYHANTQDELNLTENDVYLIIDCSDTGWWYGAHIEGFIIDEGWAPGISHTHT